MEIKVKECELKDLHILRDICIETFVSAFGEQNTKENMETYLEKSFNPEQLASELANPHSQFFLVYYEGNLAGYLKLNWDDAQTEEMGESALEIERIYLKKDFHRLGIGRLLLGRAERIARDEGKKKLWLGVWEHNESAIAFYKSLGFVQTGSHTFYMGDEKQLDFRMEKDLTGKTEDLREGGESNKRSRLISR